MTACNVWLRPEAGYLFTDTAFYDGAGNVLGHGSKVVYSEDHTMAIACIGAVAPNRLTPLIHALTIDQETITQAEMIQALPGLVRVLHAEALGLEGYGDDPHLMLVAMIWDFATGEPRAFAVSSGGKQPMAGPFVLAEITGYSTPEVPGTFPVGSGPLDPTLDPRLHAVPVLEAQRAVRLPNGTGMVGGEGQMFVVSPSGIKRETIVKWQEA